MTTEERNNQIQQHRRTIAYETNRMNEELSRLRQAGIAENARPREEERIRGKYSPAIRGANETIQRLMNAGQ